MSLTDVPAYSPPCSHRDDRYGRVKPIQPLRRRQSGAGQSPRALIDVLARPDRPDGHDDVRPRLVDISWRRARRLRLLLADAEAAEPRR